MGWLWPPVASSQSMQFQRSRPLIWIQFRTSIYHSEYLSHAHAHTLIYFRYLNGGFHKWGVPPLMGFSIINQPAFGVPFMETPIDGRTSSCVRSILRGARCRHRPALDGCISNIYGGLPVLGQVAGASHKWMSSTIKNRNMGINGEFPYMGVPQNE